MFLFIIDKKTFADLKRRPPADVQKEKLMAAQGVLEEPDAAQSSHEWTELTRSRERTYVSVCYITHIKHRH